MFVNFRILFRMLHKERRNIDELFITDNATFKLTHKYFSNFHVKRFRKTSNISDKTTNFSFINLTICRFSSFRTTENINQWFLKFLLINFSNLKIFHISVNNFWKYLWTYASTFQFFTNPYPYLMCD